MIHNQHHHLIAYLLHLLAGGGLALIAAALAQQFGSRSADRLPGETRYPQCFYCLKPFSWQEMTPLFAWLLRPDTLSFPCPCGLRKNQWSQPLAEMTGAIIGILGIFLMGGWTPLAFPLCLGLGLLPAIAFIDFHFGVIPDGLNLLVAFFGLWWTLESGGDIWTALLVSGALLALGLICALGYSRLRGQEMLGLGDVKFFAAAGLWLQPDMAPWFLALGGFIGAAGGIVFQRLTGNKEFPFGPALCVSLVACVMYQITRIP